MNDIIIPQEGGPSGEITISLKGFPRVSDLRKIIDHLPPDLLITDLGITGHNNGHSTTTIALSDTIPEEKPVTITEPVKHARELTNAEHELWLNNWLRFVNEGGGIGKVSDGYHTFDELYHHRTLLFASLCNMLKNSAWKSKYHDDPSFPMYDGMFIAGINTLEGSATYHCDLEYWDEFQVPELPHAPEFDGHTPEMAIQRIVNFTKLK